MLRGPFRRYALVTLIDSIGTALYLTVSVVYFTRFVGLAPAAVGSGLSIALVVGLLASVPAGKWGDRAGHKRVLVALNLAEAVLFACYPLVTNFAGFVTVVALTALAETGANPVRRALAAELAEGEGRVRLLAVNRAVYNVGFAIGSLGAGVVLAVDSEWGYRVLLLGNAVSFAIAALVVATIQVPEREPAEEATPGAAVGIAGPLRDPGFVAVAVLSGLLFLHVSVLSVGVPLWVIGHTSGPAWSVAALFVLNTAITVLFQVRASRGADTVAGAGRANLLAALVLCLACGLYATSAAGPAAVAVGLLLLATAALTAGEMFSSAGSWGMSFVLSPEHRMGEFQGAFNLITQAAQVVGPVLATTVVAAGVGGWAGLGAGFLALGLASPATAKWAAREVVGRE